MAQKRKQTQKRMRIEEYPREIREHLHQLGMPSIEAYKEWCRTHNFSQGLDKNPRQRRDELYVVTRTQAARIMVKKKKDRNLKELLPRNIQSRTAGRKTTEPSYQSHFGSF